MFEKRTVMVENTFIELTQCLVRELFIYDSETGAFSWRHSRRGVRKNKTGSLHKDTGYLRIKIDYQEYLIHRLIWLYMTGNWPTNDIDHINGIRHDNRWINLRDVSYSENQHNRFFASKNNELGVLGVRRSGIKFRADIEINGKSLYLGTEDTIEAAYQLYLKAKQKYHPTAELNKNA